jgi:hypothetical protein
MLPPNNTKHRTPANMPTIAQVSVPVTEFPNRFISPFADDPIPPLYSSIPIRVQNNDCLPCAICGNSRRRSAIIQEQANRFAGFSGQDETFVGVNAYSPFWITALSTGTTLSGITITFSSGTMRVEWGDATSSTITSGVPEGHTY